MLASVHAYAVKLYVCKHARAVLIRYLAGPQDLGTLELYYERLGEELEINDGFITGVIEK